MEKQIKLRLMTAKDTENIVKWRNQDSVRKHFIYQELFTKESHEYWIETMIDTKKIIQFIITDASSNRDIGSVYFRDISKEHHKAEYGIFIGDETYIGKGVGTQVAKLAIQYGFEIMDLHKINLRVFADNKGAIRSYEKAGFLKEAYLYDEVLIKDQYKDMILMGIINRQPINNPSS